MYFVVWARLGGLLSSRSGSFGSLGARSTVRAKIHSVTSLRLTSLSANQFSSCQFQSRLKMRSITQELAAFSSVFQKRRRNFGVVSIASHEMEVSLVATTSNAIDCFKDIVLITKCTTATMTANNSPCFLEAGSDERRNQKVAVPVPLLESG